MDDYGHGTNIAGIIAANTNNSLGVAGIGWNNNVLAVKSFDSNGLGTTINISQGITYSYSNGAKVLNLSFAGINNSSIIQDEINIARNSYGCVIVASSGNYDPSAGIYPPTTVYPAAMDNVISVGASSQTDSRPSWSNYGNFLDISSPGVNIRVPTLSDTYEYNSGTSFAAPHVSGLAALLFSHPAGLSALEIENFILGGAIELGIQGWDKYYGSGRVDMFRSLYMAGSYQNIYAPNITKNYSGWTTPLVIQNIDSGTGMIFNVFVDDNSEVINGYGKDISQGQSASFNPQHIDQVYSGFQGSSFSSGNINLAGIVNEHSNLSSMAYEAISQGSDKVYLPNITKSYFGWTTPIIIQNMNTTQTAQAQVAFYDPGQATARYTTGQINIPPASSYGLNPARISAGNLPSGWKGSAIVTSNGPDIMAVVNEQSSSQSMAYNGFIGGAKNLYLPNITRKYWGWTTPFVIQNISTSNASLIAEFYPRGSTSSVLTLTNASLVPNSSWSINPSNYTSLSNFQGSVVVSSSQDVVAIVNEHSQTDSMAYSGVAGGSSQVYLPNITKKYFGWSTPFIIQNTAASVATVTVSYYRSDGSLEKSIPNKTIAVGGSLFVNPDRDTSIPSSFKGSVVVTSSANVAAIANEHKTDGQAMSYNGF